jgi:hypothetical protein
MAMLLFTGLNGLAVVFFVYVLVQFWEEEHRSKKLGARGKVIEFSTKNKPTVVVVTQLISGGLQVADAPSASAEALRHSGRRRKPAPWRRRVELAPVSDGLPAVSARVSQSAHAGFSVISRQTRTSSLQERELRRDSANGADVMSLKRFFAHQRRNGVGQGGNEKRFDAIDSVDAIGGA